VSSNVAGHGKSINGGILNFHVYRRRTLGVYQSAFGENDKI
jgi:hypothetical protein